MGQKSYWPRPNKLWVPARLRLRKPFHYQIHDLHLVLPDKKKDTSDMSPYWKSNAQGESKALRRRAIDFSSIVCIAVSCSIKNAQFVDTRFRLTAQCKRISARVAALTSLVYHLDVVGVAK